MQAGMERFTKAKTLAAIVAELQKLASATAPAVAVSIDVSSSVAVVAAAIDFTAALIGIVAERTGYPPEMLVMDADLERSEEHTSELQSLMRISYAVFCLKKNNNANNTASQNQHLV